MYTYIKYSGPPATLLDYDPFQKETPIILTQYIMRLPSLS